MAHSRDDFIISIRYALLKKGAKQKFSLFFLISFSVLIIFLDKISLPITTFTRSVLNDIVYQISFVASTPGKVFNYLNDEKSEHFNIVNTNIILKEEIEALKSERYDALFLMTENTILKQALKLGSAKNLGDEASIRAKVALDHNSPYSK